jgi:tetratricopeptide (TPR) repeat protein
MEKKEFYKLTENPYLLNGSSLEDLQQLTEKYPFFHAAWILYIKSLKNAGNPRYETVLKKAAPMLPDRKQLYIFLHSKNEELYSNYSLDYNEPGLAESQGQILSLQGKNLIDKFLSSQPGPIKPDKPLLEKYSGESHEQVVARSLSEDDELVTETLAMIYFNQKKYDKALEAFRKLSLKYPEKSIYFASRIEEIEKLKNT